MIQRFLVLAGLLLATEARAVTEITERLASGAAIRIAVPDAWTPGDPLVLYQHGFDMEQDDNPDLGPLRERQLAQGYALAASGYSQSGWALFRAVQDNRDLLAYFTQRFGAPGSLITMGGSMGGLIALKVAESDGFANTLGVYSLCPPAAGARSWDSALDLRLSYDAICAGVGGGELLRGDAPLEWAYNLEDIPADLGDLNGSPSLQQTLARITQCTGVTLPSWLRTPPMRDRLERLMAAGRFSNEDFLVTNLGYATFALGDLVRSPDKMGGRNPFATRGVNYDDGALIDPRVPRFDADALAAYDFARASSLSGAVPELARVVSLHTSGDELVRLAHQQELRALYGSKLLSVPVQEDAPSHCGFKPAEGVAGWEQLRAWIDQPTASAPADALQSRCALAMQQGEQGPCRFAPELDVGDLASTMRERDAEIAEASDPRLAAISGSWFDPARPGEGLMIERLNRRDVMVVWFTYPAATAAGDLLWIGALGRIEGRGIQVSDVRSFSGPSFGTAYRVEDWRATPWGRFELVLDGARPERGVASIHMRYQGPAAYGSGERIWQRFLPVGPAGEGREHRSHPDVPADWQYSGTWVDPARTGEVLVIQQSGSPREGLTSVGWFTYDATGRPVWVTGAAYPQGSEVVVPLLRFAGTRFGSDYQPNQITQRSFGDLRLRFGADCERVQFDFQSRDPAFESIALDLQRLTKPDLVTECVPP